MSTDKFTKPGYRLPVAEKAERNGPPDPENPTWADGQPQQAQEQGEQPALDGSKLRKSHEDAAYQTERLITRISEE